MDRPALKVITKILNEVCSHFTMDYDIECPEFLEKLFENEEYRKAHVKFLEMVLKIKTAQNRGDERLLRAIFGELDEVFEEIEAQHEEDYKERVGKEYWELTEKHNKLTKFLEAYEKGNIKNFKGSIDLLKHQEHQMYEYLQTLQKRAVVENIELGKYKENK